jgi:hypothetical protein
MKKETDIEKKVRDKGNEVRSRHRHSEKRKKQTENEVKDRHRQDGIRTRYRE